MNPETEKETLIISEEEVGERLDRVLAIRFHDRNSRTYFQNLISWGKILLNGQLVKKQTRPKLGDLVEIDFILPQEVDLTPEPIPLDILFEDDEILVVN